MSKVCCGLHQEYTLYFTYYKNVNYCYYYNYCDDDENNDGVATIIIITLMGKGRPY